jgi:hypothetical protein
MVARKVVKEKQVVEGSEGSRFPGLGSDFQCITRGGMYSGFVGGGNRRGGRPSAAWNLRNTLDSGFGLGSLLGQAGKREGGEG